MVSAISATNSIGIPIVNKYISVDGDTTMVPFTQYDSTIPGGEVNYFFPSSLNTGDLFCITDSGNLLNVVTISVAPASGQVFLHNNIEGTSITSTTGVAFTFFVPDGFEGIIIIKDTNGATFRLNP